MKQDTKGTLTLCALLVFYIVIAILGILTSIVVPRLSGFRDIATEKADKATAATIANAAELHSSNENLKEDDKKALTIEKLQGKEVGDSNLLDSNLKPQNPEKDSFILHYDSLKKIFFVTYNDSTTSGIGILYPANLESKEE